MQETYAATQYEKACALLPERLGIVALELERREMARVEELRLRIGRPLHLSFPEREIPLPQTRVIGEDLRSVVDRVTEFSRYTAIDTLRRGFLTAEGGFRIGVCGTVLPEGNDSGGMRDISSLSIRIPREVEGAARPFLGRLLCEGRLESTLILSPPGGGKTTFLRDLVRLVSDGSELLEPMRVSLVDERGEIAAMYRAKALLSVGGQTDVLDACPKAVAVPMLMRAMSPQVIAVDEVALPEDVNALVAAANCGVVLLATVHCASVEELKGRAMLRDMLGRRIFRKAVVVEGRGNNRRYRVEELL